MISTYRPTADWLSGEVAPTATPTKVESLALVGLTLIHDIEECRTSGPCSQHGDGCRVCDTLDGCFDVDLVCRTKKGATVLVSYRDQAAGDYDFQTLTFRHTTGNGNPSQVSKMLSGVSVAHAYVQAYPSGVAYAYGEAMRARLRDKSQPDCVAHHGNQPQRGSGGQLFVAYCERCGPVRYIPRDREVA